MMAMQAKVFTELSAVATAIAKTINLPHKSWSWISLLSTPGDRQDLLFLMPDETTCMLNLTDNEANTMLVFTWQHYDMYKFSGL